MPDEIRPRAFPRFLGVATALLALSLLVFWPGIAMYDSVQQYRQALSGAYDDWHPPVMAHLWALLLPFGAGSGAMLVLQLGAYWAGLGLLAGTLGGRRAIAIILIGLFPPFLGWQAVILKDSQMAGALLLGTGIAGFFLLRGRRIPPAACAAAGACIAYATLVRANAAFSSVPLAVLLLAPPSLPRAWRALVILLGIVSAIAASQLVNHILLHARDSGVQRSAAIYDLAGIAVRTGDAAATGIAAPGIATLRREHCVKPLFWDSLTGRPACEAAISSLEHRAPRQLYLALAYSAAAHPTAYLLHRLSHLNATERWLVAPRWPLGSPPSRVEPNELGLRSPGCPLVALWQRMAGILVETPLGWPVIWVVIGLWGLLLAHASPPDGQRTPATALLISALVQEASFAVLSISSDLRYHLWSMIAVALAWAILWRKERAARHARAMLILLALVIAAGLATRMMLPEAPATYRELLA